MIGDLSYNLYRRFEQYSHNKHKVLRGVFVATTRVSAKSVKHVDYVSLDYYMPFTREFEGGPTNKVEIHIMNYHFYIRILIVVRENIILRGHDYQGH